MQGGTERDPAQHLRREINAISGLLHFSMERRYPPGVIDQLRELLRPRLSELARLGAKAD